jgi:hypothetical protein
MAQIVEWEGQPFALMVHSELHGSYLVPPVVMGTDGEVMEGREVLQAIVDSGETVGLPVIRGATPAVLAEIDRRMAHLSAELGVRIGPVDDDLTLPPPAT